MKRLAVLGHPVGHSRSPAMHGAAFAALGIDAEWSYEAIDLTPADFESRVREMPGEGFVGASVTVPHKGAALALADELTETAREIGAANTLLFGEEGIRADNTDVDGLLGALPIAPAGRRALLLGAGGAARAVLWALLREGAEVEVWNRTPLRAEHLCQDLGGAAVADPRAPGFELVVNATSVGLGGEDPFAELPLDPSAFATGQVVVDMVYTERPSRLLESAAAMGATTVDGLEILIHQGAAAFRLWTGLEAPLDALRHGARDRV
jgi:shikimate dehydrogenase